MEQTTLRTLVESCVSAEIYPLLSLLVPGFPIFSVYYIDNNV
jgi:hypothetical protein